MKLAIMQPYFMPYLGYFQAIAAVDKYILYDNLSYILEGWINRNRIRFRNAEPNFITVPIVNKSPNILIRDIVIANSQPWRDSIMRCIEQAYKKSPHYQEIQPLIEDIFSKEYEYISNLNCESIIKISRFLDIGTDIVFDNSGYLEMEEKLDILGTRKDYSFYPYMEKTRPEKKVARAIAMCKKENADFFLNAIGGVELYDKKEFKEYGISLNFIKMNDIRYPQRCKDGSFEPNLSIIDVLMNNGKERTKELLSEYTLV